MILEFALAFYGFLGTTITVVDGIKKVLEKDRKYTAEDLFKRCFVRAVKRNSLNLNILNKGYDPRKVDVDSDEFEQTINDLNNLESSDLGMGEKDKILIILVPRFKKCLILPNIQVTEQDINNYLSHVIIDAMADFYSQLPLTEQPFKQIVIESIRREYHEHEAQEKFRKKIADQLNRMEDVQKEIIQRAYLDPTVIQKESGRAEFKNPFRIVKAEEFDHQYPLLAKLFKEPANYDLIRGRDNLILAGGRGCGKSMILRSLAVPIAIAIESSSRNKPNLSYKDAGLDYFGVYIKLAKGYFDDLNPDSVLTVDAATQLFQHSFNMQLLKATLDNLMECRDSLNILPFSSSQERSIVEKIVEILGIKCISPTFTELRKGIVAEERAIGNYVGSLRLGLNATYTGQYTYVNDFPRDFCKIILDSIQEFQNSRIYFLLDEFENLAEFQQTVVNTITKLRPESLTIKLATRSMGVKSRVDLQGEPIQSPRDYQMVPLDYAIGSEYANLLIEIAEKRLKAEKCKETDIRKLLPFKVDLELGETKQYFSELLDDKERFPELGETHVRELVSNFLQERRNIDFSKCDKQEQEEWIHRMGVAVTFREQQGKKYPKMYCGFESFKDCSSGIISNFLELCKIAFYLAESNGDNVRDGEPIDPDTQNEAIYLVSSVSLNWIPKNIPKTGPKISRLLLDFGDIIREKLLKHDTEPEAARIVIKDPERLDDKKFEDVADILDDAVRWSVLHAKGPIKAYSPKHKLDVRSNDYIINRILIPSLEISPRPRWRTEFQIKEIASLLDPDIRSESKKKLMKKHGGNKQKKGKSTSIFDYGGDKGDDDEQ